MTNWTEHTWPHPDLQPPTREPIASEAAPETPAAEAPATDVPAAVAAVAGAPEVPPTEPRRPRRRWPRVVALAVLFLLVGAAVGVAGGYRSTTPARDHLRDQRDELQTQLDQANQDLVAANTAAAVSRSKSDSCQRLANDSKVMVDDFDQLTKLWDDPANQNVVVGSAQDLALSQKVNDIVTSMTFTRGLVTSDAATCTSTATTT